jgi:acetoin utilization protein AcuB
MQATLETQGGVMARAEQPQQPLTAADIMTGNPAVVDSTATVQDVADVMLGADVRHVPVVNRGTLVGMVSDRDLRSYLLPRPEQIIRADDARARLEANVGMVMRTDILTVTPETPVAAIIDLFLQEHIGAVPVQQSASHVLPGMVSYIDVLRVARAFF